jgi:hypothetical protein
LTESKVSVELPTYETPFPTGKGAAITPQCLSGTLPSNQVEDVARYQRSVNSRQCSSGG